MKIKKVAAAIALTCAFSAVSHANVLPQSQKDSSWARLNESWFSRLRTLIVKSELHHLIRIITLFLNGVELRLRNLPCFGKTT